MLIRSLTAAMLTVLTATVALADLAPFPRPSPPPPPVWAAGALILSVTPGSPATRVVNAADGRVWYLEAGDVITHVNDVQIKTDALYYAALAQPGKTILRVVDGKDEQARYFIAQPERGLLGVRFVVRPPQQGSWLNVPQWALGLGVALCATALGQWLVRRRRVVSVSRDAVAEREPGPQAPG